jgi:hypothetical protein
MLVNHSSKRSGSYIFKITLVASVGGFLFGYDLVIIAEPNIHLQPQPTKEKKYPAITARLIPFTFDS